VPQVGITAVGREALADLRGQFPRGGEDEGANRSALMPLGASPRDAFVGHRGHQLLQHRQGKGCRFAGAGAEIAAALSEASFFELEGPIGRVAAADVPTPYSGALEAASIPDAAQVTAAVRAALGAEGAS